MRLSSNQLTILQIGIFHFGNTTNWACRYGRLIGILDGKCWILSHLVLALAVMVQRGVRSFLDPYVKLKLIVQSISEYVPETVSRTAMTIKNVLRYRCRTSDGIVRSRNSKDSQYNSQQKKKPDKQTNKQTNKQTHQPTTNNGRQSTIQKNKNWAMPIPLNTGTELS